MGIPELFNQAVIHQRTTEKCQFGRTLHLSHVFGQEVPCPHRLFRAAERLYSQGGAILVIDKLATNLVFTTIDGMSVITERA
jgi:hypothetical protein